MYIINGHSINSTGALRDVFYDNQHKSIYNFCIVLAFRQILYNQRVIFTPQNIIKQNTNWKLFNQPIIYDIVLIYKQ